MVLYHLSVVKWNIKSQAFVIWFGNENCVSLFSDAKLFGRSNHNQTELENFKMPNRRSQKATKGRNCSKSFVFQRKMPNLRVDYLMKVQKGNF